MTVISFSSVENKRNLLEEKSKQKKKSPSLKPPFSRATTTFQISLVKTPTLRES